MPTGYTASIANGITFKEYAMGCARAFGACIELRDEPADTPIPNEFSPSDYHAKALAEASATLAHLLKMSFAEITQAADEARDKSIEYHSEAIRKNADLKAKYEAMLKAVDAYVAPSAEHLEFKAFMRKQIEESIQFDCGGDYHEKMLANVENTSAARWHEDQVAEAKRSIEYHTKEYQKEIDRANGRTRWVKQLRESLCGVEEVNTKKP